MSGQSACPTNRREGTTQPGRLFPVSFPPAMAAGAQPEGWLLVQRNESYPKSRRLLRPPEFREVYDKGIRLPCSCFVAFCLKTMQTEGPKFGFTTPRALGKSTVRNRMRRRVRETFRKRLWRMNPHWRIVVNLRRQALDAPQSLIDLDVEKVFARCRD